MKRVRQNTTDRAVILHMQPNSDGLGQITADRPGLTESQQWRKAQKPWMSPQSQPAVSVTSAGVWEVFAELLLSNNLLLDSGGSHAKSGLS